MNRYVSRKNRKGQEALEKLLSIFDARERHFNMTLTLHLRMAVSKDSETTDAHKVARKEEPVCTVGGILNL